MSYFVIEDFRLGLDRRKHILSLPPGSLYVGQNVNLSRGGEIEACKDFVAKYNLPAGTFGMSAAGGQLYVFGSGAAPGGIPAGVLYQQLVHPSAAAMISLVWASIIKGKVYAIAAFAGGKIANFYNGTIIADWQSGGVGGQLTSNADVASHLAAAINTDPKYAAENVGTTIQITGLPGAVFTCAGTAANGGGTNDQTATVSLVQAAATGVPQISNVVIGGTFEAADTFTITLAGVAFGGAATSAGEQATVAIIYKSKAYAIAGADLFGSVIDDPATWVTGTGSFVIDMSSQNAGSERLTALGIFQNNLAIFARNTTQVWSVDSDPANNALTQVLENIGTLAPRTVLAFGDQDLFFLSDTGLRSLKVRLTTDSATLSDIGSPVDPLIIAAITAAGGGASKAVAALDPVDGRYLLHIGEVTYAFSFFPSGKVSGWTTYEFGLAITDFAVVSQRVYARAGDVIYLMGGDSGQNYTTQAPVVTLPFLSARQIATWKHFNGLDVACDGQWKIEAAFDPNQPDETDEVAIVTKTTFGIDGNPGIPVNGESQFVSLKLTGTGDGKYARIATIGIHYEPEEA